MEPSLRIVVRVRPGASRDVVGGSQDGALVVRVTARALDGKATEATLKTVADAFGVRRRAVTLVSGTTSRTKVLQVEGGSVALLKILLALT